MEQNNQAIWTMDRIDVIQELILLRKFYTKVSLLTIGHKVIGKCACVAVYKLDEALREVDPEWWKLTPNPTDIQEHNITREDLLTCTCGYEPKAPSQEHENIWVVTCQNPTCLAISQGKNEIEAMNRWNKMQIEVKQLG